MKSVSGINHRAAAADGQDADVDRRLGSIEHQPGTVWAYNNWDYNALTTIFERRTGLSVARAFQTGIAAPLGLRDYKETDSTYIADPSLSVHRAAMFRLSARDLAAFAELHLNQGKVGDRQILPASWMDAITSERVSTGIGGLRAGHGYLWWLPSEKDTGLPEGTYFAWGLGNQTAFVIPKWNTVVVHLSDTREATRRWFELVRQGNQPDAALERLIVDCFQPNQATTAFCVEHRLIGTREFTGLIARIVSARSR